MPDDLTELNADIAQVQNQDAGFGTGRLVAENLILTAAHTLWRKIGADPVLDGWQVRLERDRKPDDWPFRRDNTVIWHDEARDLALIQLVRPEAGPLRPRLRLRVATVSWNNHHSVEARGYPRAGKEDNRPRELIPVCGKLHAGTQDKALFFGVDPADLPNHPHEDWPGISGSAVAFSDWPDRQEIWVYGVVRGVPGSFDRQLRVSRLAEVWQGDARFRSLLVKAGAPDLDAEDPTVLRIPGANPVTIYQPTERLIETPPPGSNPYKGLLYFDESDADRFFGRERLTEELYDRLTRLLEGDEGQLRLLPVLGASGSGKSSLVRAGLVPRLARERRPKLIEPRMLVLTPGPHPLEALARALARLAPSDAAPLARVDEYLRFLDEHSDGLRRIVDNLPDLGAARLILVIDQFEELYVTAAGPKEREVFEAQRDRFIATLIDAASDRGGRLIALIAMRSDFLGEAMRHPKLDAQLAHWGFIVPAMGKQELEHAIRKPAEQAKWPYKFQDAFVDLLVNEVLGQPGALPLLQFALQRVWDALPADPAVTLDNLGGVGGVVAGYAENEFGRLPETDRAFARRAFLDMVNLGETADTRRRARLDEITAGPAFAGRELWVLRQFARPEARLITLSQEPGGAVTFEVAHETLIRRWDRLQKWLHEGRDDVRFLARAREAAAWWEEGKGPLWTSVQLKQLSEFAQRSPGDMTERLIRFWDASVDEELWQRRRRRRSWAAAAVFVVLVLCSAAVVGEGIRRYVVQIRFQRGVEQAEKAVQSKDYFHALQSAVQAWEMRPEAISDYNQLAYEVVRETLAANQRLIRIMKHDGAVWTVAFDRTGEFIATGANDKTARLWAVRTGKAIGLPMLHDGPVSTVAFNPGGDLIATGSQDKTSRLWNARTGEPVGKAMVHDGPVTAVAFDPAGELLVTTSQDKTARIWNARTGEPVGKPMQHHDAVIAVAFDPSGDRIVTGSEDNAARLWDIRTGSIIGKPMKHENAVLVVAVDPKGEFIATGSRDKTARLWNAGTAESVGKSMSHGGPVWAVAFDPRGEAIVTGSGDRTARLWKVRTCEPFGKAMQHDGPIKTVGFDPRGRFVLTGSLDKTARLWDPSTGEPIGKPMQHEGIITAIAFSRNQELVVTGSEDNTIRLWDTHSAEPIEKPLQHDGPVTAVAFAPAGDLVATGSEDNTARLWDTRSAKQVGAAMRHNGPVVAIAFDAEGKSVVTGSEDGTGRLWSTETGEPTGEIMQHGGPVRAVAFDQKHEVVVTGSEDNTARLWDSRTGEPIGKPMQHDHPVIAIAVDSAGTVIATASQNTARLWDAHTGAPLGKPMQHHSAIKAIALNSTGTLLATGAEWKDNTAQLWDTRTGDPVGSPMRHVSDVLALAFDPTGGLLATGSASNTAQLWNARTGAAVGKPMEHTGPVTAVVFDRRGRFLASASGDNTARLWNAHTGDPIGKPMEHGGPVWAIAFDANGKLLATGSDNAARLWLTLSAQTLFERARAILGSETEPVRPSSSPALFIWIEKKWGP